VRCANDANCLAVSEATDARVRESTSFRGHIGDGLRRGMRSMAACTAVRTGLRANGDTTHCPGCGPKSSPVPRVTAGRTAASKRGFPGRAWKRITSAQRASFSRAPRSSREAARAKRPRLPRSIDSKTGSPAIGAGHQSSRSRCNCTGRRRSQIPRLYQNVPARVKEYVFGKEAETPVLPAKHGDASGVRGAAWLWPL